MTITNAIAEQNFSDNVPAAGDTWRYNGTLWVPGRVKPGELDTSDPTSIIPASVGSAAGIIPQGRLTVSATLPVPTTDLFSATSIYYLPYTGGYAPIYVSSGVWKTISITGVPALSLSGFVASALYDIFLQESAINPGTGELVAIQWASTTARTAAGAIGRLNGYYVQSSTPSRLYLGTIRIGTTAGSMDDSTSNRAVWNYYNRIPRTVLRTVATAATTYTPTTPSASGTWRAWLGLTGTSAIYVIITVGIAEQPIDLQLSSRMRSNAATTGAAIALGYNSPTAPNGFQARFFDTTDRTGVVRWSRMLSAGIANLYILEGVFSATAGANATFTAENVHGIEGVWMC